MVTLTAKKAVDSDQLPGVPMLFKPHTAYFHDRNSDHFKVAPNAKLEGILLEVRGDDFRYLFSRPTGAGTVTELVIHDNDDPYYKLTGLKVKLKTIFDADLEEATSMFFRGNDKFKGSGGDDIFNGHGGKDKLLGKGGADTLHGGAGKDRLDGGKGSDTLDGGKGTDTYVFKTAPNGKHIDAIVKFQAGETIELGKKAFPMLSKGALPEDQFFVVGNGQQDENDYIVYNRAAGALYYDPDGSGPTAMIIFTTLQQNSTKLSADNIIVV